MTSKNHFTIKYKPCTLSINRFNLVTTTGGFRSSNTFALTQLNDAMADLQLRKFEIKKAVYIALTRTK